MKYDCSWKKKKGEFLLYRLDENKDSAMDKNFYTAKEKLEALLFDKYGDGEAVVLFDKKLPKGLVQSQFLTGNFVSISGEEWCGYDGNVSDYFSDDSCERCTGVLGERNERALVIDSYDDLDQYHAIGVRDMNIDIYSSDFLDLLPSEITKALTIRKVEHNGKRVFYEIIDSEKKFRNVNLKKFKGTTLEGGCELCGRGGDTYLVGSEVFIFYSLVQINDIDIPFFCDLSFPKIIGGLILNEKVWSNIKENPITKKMLYTRVYLAPEEDIK